MTIYLVISLPEITYIQGFHNHMYIFTVYDHIFGDFPARNNVCTRLTMIIYIYIYIYIHRI